MAHVGSAGAAATDARSGTLPLEAVVTVAAVVVILTMADWSVPGWAMQMHWRMVMVWRMVACWLMDWVTIIGCIHIPPHWGFAMIKIHHHHHTARICSHHKGSNIPSRRKCWYRCRTRHSSHHLRCWGWIGFVCLSWSRRHHHSSCLGWGRHVRLL
jgi:hypothetical protein